MGCNPYENAPIWALFLTKTGREALKSMFGIHPEPPPVPEPVVQFCACPIDTCPGLVARDDHCSQCHIRFAALIICPNCGWKQGVLNADMFAFKCWQCHAQVADS